MVIVSFLLNQGRLILLTGRVLFLTEIVLALNRRHILTYIFLRIQLLKTLDFSYRNQLLHIFFGPQQPIHVARLECQQLFNAFVVDYRVLFVSLPEKLGLLYEQGIKLLTKRYIVLEHRFLDKA